MFIDADKPSYVDYWEALISKVRPGGLLVADNALWSGRVVELDAAERAAKNAATGAAEPDDPSPAPRGEDEDEDTRALWSFNAHVAADERVDRVMLTVRDGLLLARKR